VRPAAAPLHPACWCQVTAAPAPACFQDLVASQLCQITPSQALPGWYGFAFCVSAQLAGSHSLDLLFNAYKSFACDVQENTRAISNTMETGERKKIIIYEKNFLGKVST